METDRLRSDRIEAALQTALEGGSPERLFDLVDRASGMPGRANYEALKAFGARLNTEGKAAEAIVSAMLESEKASLFATGVLALGAAASKKSDRRALERLVDLADEPLKERRDAVVEALVVALSSRADEGATAVRPFADGFLHAFVVLEAMTHARVLERLGSSAPLIAMLDDAFKLGEDAPRSADRSQGLRLLRQALPAQLARSAVRFSETIDFVRERVEVERPEMRQVLAETIHALRKILGEAETDRLRAELARHDKPSRDAAKIVKGTRKRSRGRS